MQKNDLEKNNMQSYDTNYKIPHVDLTYGIKLGEGGFGEVFRGTWQHSDVAIKRLKMQTLSPEASQELETEAKMMAELRHDNIIGFRGFCYESPHYALVMEYMPRGSLYALLHSAQDIDWQTRVQISIGAGAGLVYLHNKNILHRDIKSLNVLLYTKEQELHAKLTDFGLSKVKTDTKLTTSTAKNSSGTLAWMAPELFARRAKYEKASDIYSFAVMLWEIASRRVPFEDAHDPGLIPGWVKDGEREEIPAGTPELFQQAIESGWKPNTKDRPTAEQVVSSLKFLLQNLPRPTQGSTSANPSPNPRPQPMSGLQGNYASGVVNQPIQLVPKQPQIPHSFQGNLASKMSNLPAKPEKSNPEPHPAANFSGIANNLQTIPTLAPKLPTEAELKLAQQQAEIESLKNSMDALLKMKEQEDEKRKRDEEQKKKESHAKREQTAEAERLRKESLLLRPRLPEFLKHAVEGNLDAIKPLVEKYPGLAMLSGDIKDPAGRQFTNITAFQYATWALDKELWELLLPYLPEGEALRQLNEFEQEQSRQHGRQIDFTSLLKAYDDYINNYDAWGKAKNWDAMNASWLKIGVAQRLVPAWFIYLFCEKGADKAWPKRDFNAPFSRALKLLGEWIPPTRDGAWVRGVQVRAEAPCGAPSILNPLVHRRARKERSITSQFMSGRENELSTLVERLAHNERVNPKTANLAGKITPAAVTEFLTHTIRGDLDNVKKYLQNNPALAYAQGDITDLAGRAFKKITAFQYAVWALDKEMWQLLLTVFPEADAYDQLCELEYERQDIIQAHGAYFSFDPLLNAYKRYLDNWEGWSNAKNLDALKNCWCKEVGGAQKLMPAWFVYLFTEGGQDKAWPTGQVENAFVRAARTIDTDFPIFYDAYKGVSLRGQYAQYITQPHFKYSSTVIFTLTNDQSRLAILKSARARDLAELRDQLSEAVNKDQNATSLRFGKQ